MSKISVALVVIAIICLVLGAWPISLIALGVLIIAKVQHPEEENKSQAATEELEKENQELKAEVQKLRQELEQVQAVQRAMDKAEKKKNN